MTGLHFERWWPYVGTIAWVLIWYLALDGAFPNKPNGLLAATGTAAAVLVGFMATAKTIVLGLTGSKVFRQLVRSGYHKVLFRYLYEALLASMLLLVISIGGFFLSEKPPIPTWYEVTWMTVASGAFLLFGRISDLLMKLLKQAQI